MFSILSRKPRNTPEQDLVKEPINRFIRALIVQNFRFFGFKHGSKGIGFWTVSRLPGAVREG